MKASEFISLLSLMMLKYGDLELVIESGEMADVEFVSSIFVKNAEITEYTGWRKARFPWDQGQITNSQVFLINEYQE